MKTLKDYVWRLRIWKDTQGQDLVEYALAAAYHYADLDAQCVHFSQFGGNLGNLGGVEAKPFRSRQRLAGKLEYDPLIHSF